MSVRARRRALAAAAAATLLLLGAGLAGVELMGWAPRAVGPYIVHRTTDHNPLIVATGRLVGQTLTALDRAPDAGPARLSGLAVGAGALPHAAPPGGAEVPVGTPDELQAAIRNALPGQVITLLPGVYRLEGRSVEVTRPGRAGAPIVVRAVRPGTVEIEFGMLEGFHVSAPYWRFENLVVRGVCTTDDYCEHAFHVVGNGSHFESVNNLIVDFNAHFKINAQDGRYPDDGLIERNTLTATRPRETANPVTPIDLVTASGWTVRGNLITDFIRTGGDQVSYGAFAKGAGSGNVFERNIVWCEHKLRGQPGQRIGLSFGGGGTGPQLCRDGRCITEHDGGIMRDNLIAACSDVGIYLNSAAGSRLVDNTLIDTAGVDVRFPTSSAVLDGNLIDGQVRSRDGGLVHEGDNLTTPLWRLYLGNHPVRSLFRAPAEGDFAWRDEAPPREESRMADRPTGALDLCGAKRGAAPVYGAFRDFAGCRAP